MNKLILAAAAMAATASAATAATPGWYFSGLAGASLMPDLGLVTSAGNLHDSFDTGFAYGGAVGYDLGNGLRFDMDSVHQLSNVSSLSGTPSTGHVYSTSLMLNSTYDLMQDSQFTPYIGAGLGFQNVGGTIDGESGNKWKPAYQLEAGVRDDISPSLSLFGEYRFSQAEAARFDGALGAANQHFSDNLLSVGVTYHLGE
jgi:OmpA-OmpF porin, OOP family